MSEIRIGQHNAVITPISVEGIKFDMDGKKEAYVDKDGKKLKKIQLSKGEFKFVRPDGTIAPKGYKSLNGKPVASFTKTKEVKTYDTIGLSELGYFIENDKTYLVSCDSLKSELNGDKAITFKYVNAGFKVYKAVITCNPLLDKLIMRCFRGDLRKVDLTEKTEEIKATEEGVEKIDLDAIEV